MMNAFDVRRLNADRHWLEAALRTTDTELCGDMIDRAIAEAAQKRNSAKLRSSADPVE